MNRPTVSTIFAILAMGMAPSIQATSLLVTPSLGDIRLVGQAQAIEYQDVVAKISGVVQSQPLEVGDKIAVQQTILRIEPDEFEREVKRQRALVDIAAAQVTITSRAYQRFSTLQSKQTLAKHDLDLAKAEYQVARAQLNVANLSLEQATANLADTELRAGLDGYVVTKWVEQGAWVNKGQPLYRIGAIQRLIGRFYASETQVSQYSIGMPVRLWSDTQNDWSVSGHIKRIGVEQDNQLNAYPIEVEFDNHAESIKPGMTLYAQAVVAEQTP